MSNDTTKRRLTKNQVKGYVSLVAQLITQDGPTEAEKLDALILEIKSFFFSERTKYLADALSNIKQSLLTKD